MGRPLRTQQTDPGRIGRNSPWRREPQTDLFDILFPSAHEAVCFIYRIGVKGCRYQRYFDLSSSDNFRCGQHLVCYARYGTDRCDLCGNHDDTLYKTVIC